MKLSLTRILVATVTLTFLALLSALTAITAEVTSKVEEVFAQQEQGRAKLFAELIRQDMLSGFYPGVAEKCRRLIDSTDVIFVQVESNSGDDICNFRTSESSSQDWVITLPISESREQASNFGSITIGVQRSQLTAVLTSLTFSIVFVVVGLFIAACVFVFVFSKLLLAPMKELSGLFALGCLSKLDQYEPRSRMTELYDLENRVVEMAGLVMNSQEQEKKSAIYRAIAEKSRQIAHDIRSPLSALNVLARMSNGLSEQKRHLLVSATERIKDIADGLLIEKLDNTQGETLQLTRIGPILQSIVQEKRIEYRGKAFNVEIDADRDCQAKCDPLKLKSIVSNLINNSFEAQATSVVVRLKGDNSVLVILSDDGKGMPHEIIKNLAEGKSVTTKQSGHGLGLSDALKTIKNWGGEFNIQSSTGSGTQIQISLEGQLENEYAS